MKIPKDFPKEYNFQDLSDWFKENRPDLETPCIIEMTYDQEQWYRALLLPKFQPETTVSYRGIPIIIYEV